MGTGGGKAATPVGGMKKKRPGLTLSAMSGGDIDGNNGSFSESPAGSLNRGGGAGFIRPEEGGTPFSNFSKIVCARSGILGRC